MTATLPIFRFSFSVFHFSISVVLGILHRKSTANRLIRFIMPSLTLKSAVYENCPRSVRRQWDRIEASETARRLLHGAIWSLLGAIAARGLMFASSIVVAKMLGREGFGEWGVVRSTLDMVAALSGVALAQTATKHLAANRRNDPARAGRILGLLSLSAVLVGAVSGLILWATSSLLSTGLGAAGELTGVLQIAALLLLFQIINRAQTGMLAGFEAFKTTARLNLVFGLLAFPLIVLGAWRFGVAGTAAGMMAAYAIQAVLVHRVVRREAAEHGMAIDWSGFFSESRLLWQFSLPAAMAGVVIAPTHWLSRAMLVKESGGFHELGGLAAALTLQSLLLFLGTTLNGPLIALLARTQHAKHERLERINVLSTWLFGVLTAMPLLCFPEFFSLLFGAEYVDPQTALTFALVVFTTAVILFKQGIARSLVANELLWWGFASNALWAAAMLGSAVALLGWGAMGLAAASLIAYGLTTVVFFPLYTAKQLVPRSTLLSAEAAGVWLALLAALACAVYTPAWPMRLVACVGLMAVVIWLSARLTGRPVG